MEVHCGHIPEVVGPSPTTVIIVVREVERDDIVFVKDSNVVSMVKFAYDHRVFNDF